MNHWSALNAIKPILEANPDVILVNEGANTLDDTRDTIDMQLPRHRIDCATWAIMGMGMGSCVGAAVATSKQVVAIEGIPLSDSREWISPRYAVSNSPSRSLSSTTAEYTTTSGSTLRPTRP